MHPDNRGSDNRGSTVYSSYNIHIHVHVYTRQYAYADKFVSVRGSMRKFGKDKSSEK